MSKGISEYTPDQLENSAKNIGTRLHILRTTRRIKIETAARKAGISVKQLERLEKGEAELNLHTAMSFARIYDVSLNFIILGVGEPK